jgi:hypothetical protein
MTEAEAGITSSGITEIPTETLRIVFDVATSSLNFSSGFLDHEEVLCLRAVARLLGIDPRDATPDNFLRYPFND